MSLSFVNQRQSKMFSVDSRTFMKSTEMLVTLSPTCMEEYFAYTIRRKLFGIFYLTVASVQLFTADGDHKAEYTASYS